MSNAEIFKAYLAERNLKPKTWDKDNLVYFQFRDKIKGGSTVTSEIILNENGMVTIYGFDYIPLPERTYEDTLYKLIHDINKQYAYVRFYIDDINTISTICSFPCKNNFDGKLVMDLVNQNLNAMEDQYATIMKQLWS